MKTEQKRVLEDILAENAFEDVLRFIAKDAFQFAIDAAQSLSEENALKWTQAAIALDKIAATFE